MTTKYKQNEIKVIKYLHNSVHRTSKPVNVHIFKIHLVITLPQWNFSIGSYMMKSHIFEEDIT